MAKISAGVLLYRATPARIEVLLVHPGGPLWARKDAGAWSIPKGELDAGELPEAAAVRELREETGWAPVAPLAPLGQVKQRSGKVVHAWATPLDVDPATLRSGTFTMEWPPGSGLAREFPEVDRAAWFDLEAAAARINPGQAPLLERLARLLAAR